MKRVYIVSAKRTAIGAFGGAFKDFGAVQLGVVAAKAAMEQVGVDRADEVIFGNVLGAGLGQNVARQIALGAGLANEVSAYGVNLVCGSGLKAVELAYNAIRLGDADIVVAGGAENMSQSPYVLNDARFGLKMGNKNFVDTMIVDGLTDAFNGDHMGITAENIAKKYNISREEQDIYAAKSQSKAIQAIKDGKFKDEIASVVISGRKGDTIVDTDEYPRDGTTAESLAKLRPAFAKDGSVTAGNASGINDGAAALVLMSKEKADELGLKPLAEIISTATAGVCPTIMGTGPIPATQKALEKANLTIADIDLFEANEAFAAQALAVLQELGINQELANVNGGAIALGHPIGASGARVLVSLIHEMNKRGSKYGLATLCIGGGQGISMIIKGTKN